MRWAVLGTANIAAHAFLPALRAAGDSAVVVGSRTPETARGWAQRNQVTRAADYHDAIHSDDVDAVYIAVPNSAHVRWATEAAAAGKAVLCEKPLGRDAAEVNTLLSAVGPARLWEAFVFPFHPQTDLITRLCAESGDVGPLQEIVSEFHFAVSRPDNIRWSAAAGGGALLDVGCYPIRLARLLFDAEPDTAAARAHHSRGVDADIAAVLDFPPQRRLVLSAGMRRAPSTFTRLIGADAELRVTNPFHPGDADTVQLWRAGHCRQTWPAGPGKAFEHALRHLADVLRGRAEPRHLAATDAPGNARALDLVRAAAAAVTEVS